MAEPLKMRSATATGRKLELSQGLLVPVMRSLLEHPRAAEWRKALALLAAGAFILRRVLRKGAGRTPDAQEARNAIISAAPGAAKPGEESRANDSEKKEPDAVSTPTERVSFMDLLRTEDGRLSVGLPDFAAVMLASLLSAYAMIYKGSLLATLMQAQNSQDSATWVSAAMRYPVCCVVAAALQTSFGYFKSRFSLQWRYIVTQKLHGLYFSNMSYYRVMNCRKGLAIDDPDIRICQDVQGVCEAYSNIAVLLANSVLMSYVFSRAMRKPAALLKQSAPAPAQGRDWKWSLVSPIFTCVFVPFAFGVLGHSPLTWVHYYLQAAKSKYEQILTRVQLHGERICMLQGEQYELAILNRGARAQAYWNKYAYLAQFPRELVQSTIFSDSSVSLVPQIGLFTAQMILAQRLRQAGGRAAAGVVDQDAPIKEAASDFGAAIQDNWTVMYSIGAWGALVGAFVGLGYTKASGDRVTDLFACLTHLHKATPREDVFEDSSTAISFDDVTVQTPTQQLLLKSLTFRVCAGETLLISGHNGAGKSSIIRCLCNLWPVPSGRITRPGGAVHAETDAALHEQVYYLPQKPVNVLGSLSDQLTYPLRPPGGLPELELRRWLRYVDLEYLVDRAPLHVETDDTPRDWGELLSLGEQQALSIARLLYHRPRFAILDECTSAISRRLERRLFEVAHELGMACITITHRPALQEHHMRALRLTGSLEADDKGWRIDDLPGREQLLKVKRGYAAEPEEAKARIEAYLARVDTSEAGWQPRAIAPEAEGKMDLEAEVRKRWPNSVRRCVAVVRLGLQEPELAREFGLKVLLLSGILAVRARLIWDIWMSVASASRCALTGDFTGIWASILTNVVLSPLNALADSKFSLMSRNLSLDLWANAKCLLHARALGTGAFLRVMQPGDAQVPHVENPVQRVAEAGELFGSLQANLEPVLMTMSLAAYSLPTLYGGGGPVTLAVLGGSFLLFGACQAVAPNWKHITVQIKKLETRFQVLHTRLRHVAEPVAFSGGGGAERSVVEPRFSAVCAFRRRALRDEFLYNWVMAVFSSYDLLPMGVQRLLAWRFASRNLPAGSAETGVSPRVIAANLLYDRSIQFSQQAEMKLVTFLPEWQRLDGKLLRLLELVVAFDAADAVTESAAPASGSTVAVRGLDLVTPRGACLATGISFDLPEGAPLLITGPNASGKSLLGCMLLGILPPPAGSISLPGAGSGRAPLEVLMAAPQRVYLPLGTLGDQVCYPQSHEVGQEDRMLEALEAAGIAYLRKREPDGWQARRIWEDALSGGEQQRMALARVFYRRPRFALLDECTSMVACDAEEGLYRALVRDFGITPLTLTQRLFMPDLYTKELRLGLPTPESWALGSPEEVQLA